MYELIFQWKENRKSYEFIKRIDFDRDQLSMQWEYSLDIKFEYLICYQNI